MLSQSHVKHATKEITPDFLFDSDSVEGNSPGKQYGETVWTVSLDLSLQGNSPSTVEQKIGCYFLCRMLYMTLR